ncbi:MAG: hypothetical protein IPK15_25350, partial [Verrucomicrobia bacterium]|nr:hypothetical protein [Verrucomicrobiota bacterium]
LNTLSVTGTVTLAGATLSGLPSSAGLLFGATESVLIQNDGADPVIGTFAGLPEGAFVETVSGGLTNRITYVGGDGNDVSLRSVPPVATQLTRVWDGDGTNASWTTAGNWIGNIRPRNGDDILFPVNAQQKRNHVNAENTLNLFLANSLRFEGADYVITNLAPSSPFSFDFGVVGLTAGIRAAQPFGQNTLSTFIGVMADQDWDVASEEGTLRFDGASMGRAIVRKTGLGRLEGTNAFFTNGVQFVNVAGSSHFENTGFESVTIRGGFAELLRSGASSLVATGGFTHLAGTVAPSLSVTGAQLRATAGTVGSGAVLTPNATTNFNLGPGARCTVEFPTSNSVAFLLLGAMNINGAQLDVEIGYPIRPGERLAVASPYAVGSFVPFPPIFPLPTNQPPPAVINGTFDGLPDGAVATFSGRPFRINYALTNGQIVLPGVFLTALPIAPRFNKFSRQPSGLVLLQGFAERGSVVLLEGSQDFVQWTLLDTTVTGEGGEFQLRDTLATGLPFRFPRKAE